MNNRIISLFSLLLFALAGHAQLTKVKVLIDNDFCGDPDGLFQLAHQVLCPTTEIVGIVGGHLNSQPGFTNRKDQATASVDDNGHYQPNPTGRIIRVYTQIDSRLMFVDMTARLQQFKS